MANQAVSVGSVARVVGLSLKARMSPFRGFPDRQLLISEPLALAEDRTNRLRRIYEKCTANVWDGPTVFREAVARHGGIQLDAARRPALASIVARLTWGELAAWLVSADLAERLDDPDARLAASSQVFDEARHFYILRDYLALLHVPVPELDPYFAIALRALLTTRDLTVKVFAMQILVEGVAQAIFRFLSEEAVEPVLGDVLGYITRDEARHVGLGVIHLPQVLSRLSRGERRRIGLRVRALGDLLGISFVRDVRNFEALGLEARELLRQADGALTSLSEKLGVVPGTEEPYFSTDDPSSPAYAKKLALLFPESGAKRPLSVRLFFGLVDFGAMVLPS